MKKYAKTVLIIVALALWGHNGYRFFSGVNNADEPTAEIHKESDSHEFVLADSNRARLRLAYDNSSRDPFRNWLTARPAPGSQAKPKTRLPQKVQKKTVTPPKLTLLGVIEDPGGSMAIIEDAQKNVHFAVAKDTISGVAIKSVAPREITVSFDNREFRLALGK